MERQAQRQIHKVSVPSAQSLETSSPCRLRADSCGFWAKTTLQEAANLRCAQMFHADGLLVYCGTGRRGRIFSLFPLLGLPVSMCGCFTRPPHWSPRDEDDELSGDSCGLGKPGTLSPAAGRATGLRGK